LAIDDLSYRMSVEKAVWRHSYRMSIEDLSERGRPDTQSADAELAARRRRVGGEACSKWGT